MIDWQKPFDTAPKDGRWILIWADSHDVYGNIHHEPHLTCWIKGGWYNKGRSWCKATAWAEINPPERGGWDHMVARQNEYVIDNPTEGMSLVTNEVASLAAQIAAAK